MSTSTSPRRFRVNPVETVIFGAISLVFAGSVYNLFYNSQNFNMAALKPMEANPVSEGRLPASLGTALAPATTAAVAVSPALNATANAGAGSQSTTFQSLDVRCDDTSEQETAALRVRLNGSFCGLDASSNGGMLVKASVTNEANKFTATVFTDTNAAKYSTDYIPLNAGKNPIHLEFIYRTGKSHAQDLMINRSEAATE